MMWKAELETSSNPDYTEVLLVLDSTHLCDGRVGFIWDMILLIIVGPFEVTDSLVQVNQV